jgi:hypothetical protein
MARCVRKRNCFRQVPFEEAQIWENVRDQHDADYLERLGFEIISFRIDWRVPLPEIKKQALAWLQVNSRSKEAKKKHGRHAKEEVKYRDALRRLGALRLLARYPLKKVIELTKARGVKLYSEYPGHQTAWENGARGVAKVMQSTFALGKTELPRSWQLFKKRRTQK